MARGRTDERKELNNRVFFRLLQVANAMQTRATRVAEPAGVTSQQWAVIGAVARAQPEGGIAVNELCRHLRISRQNLSGILSRLDELGHTARVQDAADLRSRKVRLTKSGASVWKSLRSLAGPFHENAMRGFSEAESLAFLEFIVRLEKGLSTT